eukprot:15435987-Alexandrium_andersonii.AAC.1
MHIAMLAMATCHCRNRNMMRTVVAASPHQAQNRLPDLSGGPFCAVVRAGREYGNGNLPGARLRLVLDGLSGCAE